MKKLSFSKEYRKKIERGIKRQTIRLSSSLKEGDKVKVIVGRKVLGIARITKVEKKAIEELTDEDAKRDGFKTVSQLVNALRRHYGRISSKKEIYVISFEIEDEKEGQQQLR